MGGPMVAVKHVGGYDDPGKGHCLSFLSLQEPYAIANEDFDLPFHKDKSVDGMSCRGLLYFHDSEGNSVICNLTTREIKQLSPPQPLPPPSMTIFGGCGIGYDASCEDFKVLRIFSQTISEENESGYVCFYGSTEYTQLYSLSDDSWKHIPNVDAFLHRGNTVFIKETGCCYWQACLGYSFSGRDNRMACISFDFAREEFGHLYLPPLSTSDCVYTLVRCDDALGVIICPRDLSSPSLVLEIYKWVDENWIIYHHVSIDYHHHIMSPLSIYCNQFIFLEKKAPRIDVFMGGRSLLELYDLNANKFRKIRISSDRGQMYVFPYEESMRRLTDVRNSSSSDEDDEDDESPKVMDNSLLMCSINHICL